MISFDGKDRADIVRIQVHSIAIDMKSVLSIFQGQITSQHAAPRGLGTHWRIAPVTLEDALGFIIPIPLELVNSWEVCRLAPGLDITD